jgi:hypothetical protein
VTDESLANDAKCHQFGTKKSFFNSFFSKNKRLDISQNQLVKNNRYLPVFRLALAQNFLQML